MFFKITRTQEVSALFTHVIIHICVLIKGERGVLSIDIKILYIQLPLH